MENLISILNKLVEFLSRFVSRNANALLAVPSAIKTILLISIIIMLGSGILRKAKQLVETALVVGFFYFLAVFLGVI